MSKLPTQIFPIAFPCFSDVYNSPRQRAAYQIGRPDGARMAIFNVSEQEAREIFTNLPEELLEIVKSHYGLGAAETPTVQTVDEKPSDEGTAHEIVLVDDIQLNDDEEKTVEKSDLKKLTVKELKDYAKLLEIKGYSKLNEHELIEAVYEKLAGDPK